MRIIFFLLFLCFGSIVNAQSDFDERLLAKFSEERINKLLTEHPEIIKYWTYYLDNSYQIIDGQASGKMISSDYSVNIDDLDDFNILELDVVMDRERSKTYKIAGSSDYLMLLSNRAFVNSFNNHNNTVGK